MFEFVNECSFDLAKGSANGRAFFSDTDPLFHDHFPGHIVLPGSVLIEVCAQIAGLLAEQSANSQLLLDRWAMLGMVRNARFIRAVELPAMVNIRAVINHADTTSATVATEVLHNNQVVMRAELVMMLLADLPHNAAAIDARNKRLAEWSTKGEQS